MASRDLELRGSGVGPWLNRPRGQPGGASPGALRCGARLPELRRWERDGTGRDEPGSGRGGIGPRLGTVRISCSEGRPEQRGPGGCLWLPVAAGPGLPMECPAVREGWAEKGFAEHPKR